jgi:nucleoside-diphosphate-sugar epimerase
VSSQWHELPALPLLDSHCRRLVIINIIYCYRLVAEPDQLQIETKMIILPTNSQENEENKPPTPQPSRTIKKKVASRVLGMNRCLHLPSEEDDSASRHGNHFRKSHAVDGSKGMQARQEHDVPKGWSNNGSGVFIHNGPTNRRGSSNSWSPSHKGLHRRIKTTPSKDDLSLSPDRVGLQISPGAARSPSQTSCRPHLAGYFSARPRSYATKKHRIVLTTTALGLACSAFFFGYIPSVNDLTPSGTSAKKDWLTSLPNSISESIFGGGHELAEVTLENPITSMEEESLRVQSLSKYRTERRKARTKPPLTHALISAAAAIADGVDDNASPTSLSIPRLTLSLPAHRDLEDNVNVRRELKKTSDSTPICGPNASEASKLNPNNFPPSARIGPKSRVVVTGALSQIGMEIILQLSEFCGVEYIVGIDSAQPNTRHERIEMIESRYEYLQRRVPGFQELMVPVFGIYPHPDMDKGFDLVKRMAPTHIVHLAGMEEGHGEFSDYGDTIGASAFADGANSILMRRFESLLSMDQVFRSVAGCTTSQPQIVYISSNEAAERSGVLLHSAGGMSSTPVQYHASVYGTSSLLKEVIASYYHLHHGIDSVGIRVPTIFGPFSRPGSLINDLTERTIRNAVGGDVEGLPRFHRDRDRYELSRIAARREEADLDAKEQFIFVYDVASAVLAAMQLKRDYKNPIIDPNGPTLVRIGSPMISSMKQLKERLEGHLPPAHQSEETWPNADRALAPSVHSSGLSSHDSERNLNLLGWKHKTLLHEGTKSMLAWQILKMYPYGIPPTTPSFPVLQSVIKDSLNTLSYHALPCASGCRWKGPAFCSKSPWDEVIETTQKITDTCQFVLYTVDLRTQLDSIRKQSAVSQRKGWEAAFCKIAFVSASSNLAIKTYEKELNMKTPVIEWNGSRKAGHWIVVTVPGTEYTMSEYVRSLAKLNPTLFFNENVEKAMYINHERIILTTDQAMGVMYHMDLPARKKPEKKTIVDKNTGENKDIWLPPQPQRRSVLFTAQYTKHPDTSNIKDVARFVMKSNQIAETKDIRAQVSFYDEATHYTRSELLRSPNYQDFIRPKLNSFPFNFVHSSWLVHRLNSESGHNLRCEIYEEHSLWGNRNMEDLSISFVLARNRVKMRLGEMAENQFIGPEEWHPLLIPREPGDENAIAEGPLYLDYLEDAQQIATDSRGHEIFISFLNQK